MANPLVRIMSDAEMVEQETSEQILIEYKNKYIGQTELAGHIQTFWDEAERAKDNVEDIMDEDIRQRNGEYSDTKLQAIREEGGSELFMMLTDEKCTACKAWLVDILLPPDDKPWGVTSTPVADLPFDQIEIIRNKVQSDMIAELTAMQQLGQPIDEDMLMSRMEELVIDIQNKVRERAKKFESNVERAIHDIVVEGGWRTEFKKVIDDIVDLPAGILKGPFVKKENKLTWANTDDGWEAVVAPKLLPVFKRVSPYDIYPAPTATCFEDGDLIERHRLTISDVVSLKGTPGYNDEELDAVIEEYNDGTLGSWLDETGWREGLSMEAAESATTNELVTTDNPKIDALQYWGNVQGKMLLEWGVKGIKEADKNKNYQIEAWLIDSHVIKAILNPDPLGRKPYYKASFRERNGQFWGDSLPRTIKDIQEMCNAAARSLVNNMALSSGPQVGVDSSRLAEGETITSMGPWKIWQFDESMNVTSGGRPPIYFFQPDSNASVLQSVYQFFSNEADNKTGIPKYSYGSGGSQGALSTATGISMMMNNASRGIKQVVYTIDTFIIEPSIQMTHTYMMLNAEDETLKGDINIKARGSSALLAKEQQQVRRNEALQLAMSEPVLTTIGQKGLNALLREVFRGLEFPVEDIIPSKEETEMMEKAQQQMQAMGGTPAGQQPAPVQTDAAGNVAGGRDVNAFPQGGM